MIKVGKGKTQATTVVHEGKVYRGTMPNLNMKTDLTGAFEYLATIVEGMSSGNQNGNPVFEDFKKKIIDSTIAGEVGKLINERGHVPENYSTSTHTIGRQGPSQVAIARGPAGIQKAAPRPLPNLPPQVGKATDLLVKNMTELEKEMKRFEEAIPIDVGRGGGVSSSPGSPAMFELMELFDEWEKEHPMCKESKAKLKVRLESIAKRVAEVEKKSSERVAKLAEKITYSEEHRPGKKVVKKGKKAVTKKASKPISRKKTAKKKKTKKKVAKKRDSK